MAGVELEEEETMTVSLAITVVACMFTLNFEMQNHAKRTECPAQSRSLAISL